MEAHMCNPDTQDTKAGGWFQGQDQMDLSNQI